MDYTSKIKNIFSFIKTNFDNIERFSFSCFLLSIPIQLRLTLVNSQTYLNGAFNEYATYFFYLSDIFLITTLFLFFVNYVSFKAFFSSLKQDIHSYPRLIPVFTLLVTLITWSFAGILWSEYKNITFYQSLKILELGLFFLYINTRLQWFGIRKFIWLIFISGTLESIIGVAQFYFQRSIGLKFLMESVLSPEIPNVAKIVVNGDRMIRAYGTFPHPNVFAGFLLFSIFCGVWLIYLRKTYDSYKIVSRETILYFIFLAGIIIQLNALLLTFSRSSWLAIIIIIATFTFLIIKFNLFHVKQIVNYFKSKRIIIITLTLLIQMLIIVNINFKYIINRTSINENIYQESSDVRILYGNIARDIITDSSLLGLGAGNFTLRMKDFTQYKLKLWQFQPVHNIYLLITSELGFTGAAVFFLIIYYTIKSSLLSLSLKVNSYLTAQSDLNKTIKNRELNKNNVSRETLFYDLNKSELIILLIGSISILTGYLFIGLFDHYYWTLQQGQMIFWLILALILLLSRKSTYIN